MMNLLPTFILLFAVIMVLSILFIAVPLMIADHLRQNEEEYDEWNF